MARLHKFLFYGSLFICAWLALVFDSAYVPFSIRPEIKEIIFPLPLYLLVVFGCYSLFVIGYRLGNFNDCAEAAKELSKEIKEAREDLKRKGLDIS